MKFKSLILAAALIGGGTISAHASQLSLAEATGYNVFVFSDMTGTSDSEGAVAVGGNFAPGSNGFTVGAQSAASPGGFALVVGGNFTETYNSVGPGNIYVGGSMNWTDPTISGSAYVGQSFTNGSNGGSVGGTVYYGTTYSSGLTFTNKQESTSWVQGYAPVNFSSALTDLTSLSSALAGYTANGTVVNSYGTYTLTGSSSSLNVFNLTYTGGSITINAPAGSTVVVNVAGTSDAFDNGEITLNGVSNSDVIFNFNAATSISESGYGFDGTILAPLANYTGSWGQIDGQIIANSITGTTQFNEALFSGTLPSNLSGNNGQFNGTPEPSTWSLMALAGAALSLANAKRRRAAVVTVRSRS